MDFLFNSLQLIGGLILSVGYAPQIYKTIKTKSVQDISLAYYVNLVIGVGLMEAYALYNALQGVAVMFLVTNTIALSCCSTMAILTHRYGKRK